MKKVLVLDDDEAILDVIQIVLKNANYDVAAYSSGKNILEKVKTYFPNLILLDNSMPDLESEKFVKSLRKDGEFKNIPIILVSASVNLEKRAKKLGVEDFIDKPFDMNDFLRTIGKHI